MDTRTRILLIDDDAVDRASVRRALAKSGLAHDLVEAHDGATGLRLGAAGGFDCVLLDYRLPDIDAFALLEQLLSPEGGAHAVLMLTGETDQDVALRLMRAGALDYLAKSEATPSSLMRAIRYARARRAFLVELDTARREAEEKSAALDLLNRQKTLLLSLIAHDLRNPFQALLGLSSMLGEAVASKNPATIERRAQGVHESALQAHELMEGLFGWASIQMDEAAIALDAVDLATAASEIIEGAAEAAALKTLSLRSTCTGVAVYTNRDILLTILRNLVGNAVKFTPGGGTITISAIPGHERVDVLVADSGVGMTQQKLDDLFRLDRRVTTKGTAGERGSGLGLLLCHELVGRVQGTLSVSSVVDGGTTFRLSLPRHAEPASIAPAEAA